MCNKGKNWHGRVLAIHVEFLKGQIWFLEVDTTAHNVANIRMLQKIVKNFSTKVQPPILGFVVRNVASSLI